MNMEYMLSSIISIFAILNHLLSICIYKRGTKTEKESKIFNKKSVLWDVIISVLQVNIGYNYLIRPLKLKEYVYWDCFLVTSLVIYFIACITFLFVLWCYYKNWSKKQQKEKHFNKPQ